MRCENNADVKSPVEHAVATLSGRLSSRSRKRRRGSGPISSGVHNVVNAITVQSRPLQTERETLRSRG